MTCKGRVQQGVVVLQTPGLIPEGSEVTVEFAGIADKAPGKERLDEPWRSILQFAGSIKGLPPDMAKNHDHYIHGLPKK